DEQGTGRPYAQVDRMRHQLGRLLGEARSRKIGREQPGDPAGDTSGEQDYRVDRTGDRGSALAEMDNGAWRLDRREPGPRSGPALRGFWPLLQRLGPRPSRSPDPVTGLPSPELVTRSPVPDGHALPHGSCPSLPAPHRVPEHTVGGRSEDQLDDLSAIPDPLAGAGGSPRSHPPNASCPALTGALHRSVPERLDGRVDQLVIARQRFLDEPGPLDSV